MIDDLIELMRDHAIHTVVTVANLEAAPLYFRLRDESDFRIVDTCREGEAVAVASGLHLGGHRVLLSMENFGLFECLDTLRCMPVDMGIPLPILIGFTGRPDTQSPEALSARVGNISSQVAIAGAWTTRVLDATGIPYGVIDENEDRQSNRNTISACFASARPSALLVDSF